MDMHFERYVDAGSIAGVVTHVVRQGQVVHEDSYGMAGPHVFIDREEDLVGVFMIQKMGGNDGARMAEEFETLVYQAIAD